ncbi:MAG: type II secretion system protein [Burkholderiales bacterium]|nr:type II secretion system protein [Burkholderiales bacterium]
MTAARRRGLSLVEMVISIALIGTIAVMATPLLRLPLAAWGDASRRADLTQAAAAVHSQLAQDLQRALPGSVRRRALGGREVLEMLEVRAEGRYRSGTGGAGVCPVACAAPASRDALQLGCTDACFTSLGLLEGDPPVGGSDWVVVLGGAAPDPYLGGNVAVPGGVKTRLTDVAAAPEGQRVRHGAHNFVAGSAERRFYIVSTPITWDCNPAARTLRRLSGYPVTAVQALAPVGATSNVVVSDIVSACQWLLQPGTGAIGSTLLARLQLERSAPGATQPERLEHVAQFALAPRR